MRREDQTAAAAGADASFWDAAKSIVFGLYDAAVLLDLDLRVVEYNPAYGAMTGLRPRRLQNQVKAGVHGFELVFDSSGKDRNAAQTCIRELRPVHMVEQRVVNAKGDHWVTWISFLPLYDDQNRLVAIIETLRDVTGDAQAQAKLKELLSLMKQRAQHLEQAVEERTKELRAALEQVTRLSRTDPLTGLLNRRAFTEHALQALDLARRHNRTIGFLMCDLDHFKRINDRFGHGAGDVVLVETAKSLQAATRESDRTARFGGEEFVVMLSETNPESIIEVAHRFNQAVRDLAGTDALVELPDGEEIKPTVSIGVALFPGHGEALDDLLNNADAALYTAKRSGRDCTIVFSDEMHTDEEPQAGRARILIVSQNPERSELEEKLRIEYDVVIAPTGSFAVTLTSHSHFDAIIAEEQLPDQCGIDVLGETLTTLPGALRILLVETESFYVALRAMNSARVDHFILGTETPDMIHAAVEEGLARRELLRRQLLTEGVLSKSLYAAGAQEVRSILSEKSLDFAFQCIVDEDGGTFGYEALARPDKSRFGPGDLFDAAVRSGDIWALSRLGRDKLSEYLPMVPESAYLFMNLHPAEAEDPLLLDPRNPLIPWAHRIILEITERSAIQDFEAFRRRMAELREAGFRFAVDDLGAGYASLSSVALLEPEYLKLDMSLLRDLHRLPRRNALLSRIVEYADSQGIRVVAEGVEYEEELAAAKEIGCHLFQGYHLGQPERLRPRE